MNERQWWNGSWSRLTRRDVFVRNAADGRWQVELRRGGPEGRVRTRSFGSEREAVGWVQSAIVDPDTGWRELGGAAERSHGRRAALRCGGETGHDRRRQDGAPRQERRRRAGARRQGGDVARGGDLRPA
ncbi:hypothetical protein [Dactylosporangium sp. CA-092794]|uniref:hypothetical protein n=1 Tax=Dactylosporangium sp. CA-092794 TaxID=3239929 RepID=UPI003D8E842C